MRAINSEAAMFRNITMFRFSPELSLDNLQEALQLCQLKPVGPMELASRGFISPFGRDSDQLTHSVGHATRMTVGTQDRILPVGVINEKLQERLTEVEQREGRVPGGRVRKRIKEEVLAELTPKAFVNPGRVDVVLDHKRGVCMVDASSRKTAEMVVSSIRAALGSFPAVPLTCQREPRALLTSWVAGDPPPERLVIGEECELKQAQSSGAVVRCQHQALDSDEIAKHLEAGKQVTRLALIFNERVSFVLNEEMGIQKFKLLDEANADLDQMEHDDARAELDARLALFAGEAGALFDQLQEAFGIQQLA